MNRYLFTIMFAFALVSCGNNSDKGSKKNSEVIFPKTTEQSVEKNDNWELAYKTVSTIHPLEIKKGVELDPVYLNLGFYGDNRPEFYFQDDYSRYDDNIRFIDLIKKDGYMQVTNAMNDEALVIDLDNGVNNDRNAMLSVDYIIRNSKQVTFTFPTVQPAPNDFIVLYAEDLSGFLPVYSHFMKMFHPDLPGTAVKKVE